jgi:RNA polymerase sigma-70 factor (ECF subfamily)
VLLSASDSKERFDRNDLEQLFRRHAEGLAGAVRGVLGPGCDLQEVLQEAFLKAWRSPLNGTRPTDPAAWAFVVVMNTARDLRRRNVHRRPTLSLEAAGVMEIRSHEPTPEAGIDGTERLARIRAAIHGLSENLRRVFLMRVAGELSFDAIASALSIPVGTAKTRMRRALIQVRAHVAATDAGCDRTASGR